MLDGSTARLELAKALLALGARARRRRRMLQRAHALATGCGAVPVLAGAREALAAARRASPGPRAPPG